jgi:hypothetical protein
MKKSSIWYQTTALPVITPMVPKIVDTINSTRIRRTLNTAAEKRIDMPDGRNLTPAEYINEATSPEDRRKRKAQMFGLLYGN